MTLSATFIIPFIKQIKLKITNLQTFNNRKSSQKTTKANKIKPNCTRYLFLYALLSLIINSPSTLASTLQAISDESLIAKADSIVVARCVDVKATWNSQRTRISTVATYAVEDSIIEAQDNKQHIRVHSIGGTVGNISQVIVGGPRFMPGQRSLLFLKQDPTQNAYSLVDIKNGKYDIKHNTTNGKQVVAWGKRAGKKRLKSMFQESDEIPALEDLDSAIKMLRKKAKTKGHKLKHDKPKHRHKPYSHKSQSHKLHSNNPSSPKTN